MGDATEITEGVAERARREADAYRGDNPRPLEGYAVVLGIYGILVTLTAVIAAATGMWVATAFVVGLIFAPRFTRLIAGTFTALAGADFLRLAYA